jgi:hypothetical protein
MDPLVVSMAIFKSIRSATSIYLHILIAWLGPQTIGILTNVFMLDSSGYRSWFCWPSPAQSFLVLGPLRPTNHIFVSQLWQVMILISSGCSLVSRKLLLALVSTVILGSVSYRTHDHIFLSHDWESSSCRSHWFSLYSFIVEFKNTASNSFSTVVSILVATDVFQQAAV